MILKVAGSNPAIHPILAIYKLHQKKKVVIVHNLFKIAVARKFTQILRFHVNCLPNVVITSSNYGNLSVDSVTGIFSYPNKQIFFGILIGRLYTYSTGLVLRALKVPSRSLRRQNAGYKVLFLFLLKKLHSTNHTRNLTLMVNSLRA